MPKIGQFDTDSDALVKRVSAHDVYGTSELNDWIFDTVGLSKGLNVLDLGCGFGKQTLAMLSMGCKVLAVDASLESLKLLRSKTSTDKLTTIHSSFDHMELPDILFDTVISSYSFYYSENPKLVLENIYKKMKKTGKIFICGPSFQNNIGMKNLLKKVGINFGEGSAPFMENKAPILFDQVFGNVKKLVFKNSIKFPSADSVWNYWSSHNMFDASVEGVFKKELDEHFKVYNSFETTKIALGLLSVKL
tara:strand:- start:212 stop:955 length:744 start_codon:yes stop_codon:yes gene_type:complete